MTKYNSHANVNISGQHLELYNHTVSLRFMLNMKQNLYNHTVSLRLIFRHFIIFSKKT